MDLNYKLYGQGSPLLILHGLFGSLDNWATIGRKLGDQYMTYLIDQRDHGKSPHTNAFNYELLAQDLADFMEDNWIHQGHLIGHSMGGKTVMRFALEHEDMVDKLIVLDMAPKQYANRHEKVFEAIKAVPLDQIEYRKEALHILMDKLDGDQATTAFLLKNIKREKDGSFRWKMNVQLLEEAYDAIVAPMPADRIYDGEVLFVRGGNSKYIQHSDVPMINKMFPNNEIYTMPGVGHWLHAEKPLELMDIIQDFLG